MDQENVLVFDENLKGHRDRGLRVWASILKAETTSGASRENFQRLVSWRGPVLMQSADLYPAFFSVVAARRSILGRRTIGTLLRPAHTAKVCTKRHLQRSLFYRVLTNLPLVRLVSICPRIANGRVCERGFWIYDSEWWDIGIIEDDSKFDMVSTEINSQLATLEGRPYVIFLGALTQIKGFDFYADVAVHAKDTDLAFVAAGISTDVPEKVLARFREHGGIVIDNYLSDGDLFALARKAAFIWCCYGPDLNISSGIFGRAIQSGVWPLVRAGSWLNAAVDMLGVGSIIPYGDTIRAVELIKRGCPGRTAPAVSITEMRQHSIHVIKNAIGVA
jgi:hypothetical protein